MSETMQEGSGAAGGAVVPLKTARRFGVTPAELKAWMTERGWNLEKLSEQIGFSVSMCSTFLGGKLESSARFQRAAERMFLRFEGLAGKGQKSTWVQTEAASQVLEALELADREGAFVLVDGDPGTGKTRAIEHYVAASLKEERPFVHIVARPSMTPRNLVAELVERTGSSKKKGTTDDLLVLVISRIKKYPRLLVVDEAQHLTIKALEFLRTIQDATKCGLLIAGSKLVLERLLEADAGGRELAQLYSRMAQVYRLRLASKADCLSFISTNLDVPIEPPAARHAAEVCERRLRTLEWLCKALARRYRGEGAITVEDVKAAEAMLVTRSR